MPDNNPFGVENLHAILDSVAYKRRVAVANAYAAVRDEGAGFAVFTVESDLMFQPPYDLSDVVYAVCGDSLQAPHQVAELASDFGIRLVPDSTIVAEAHDRLNRQSHMLTDKSLQMNAVLAPGDSLKMDRVLAQHVHPLGMFYDEVGFSPEDVFNYEENKLFLPGTIDAVQQTTFEGPEVEILYIRETSPGTINLDNITYIPDDALVVPAELQAGGFKVAKLVMNPLSFQYVPPESLDEAVAILADPEPS